MSNLGFSKTSFDLLKMLEENNNKEMIQLQIVRPGRASCYIVSHIHFGIYISRSHACERSLTMTINKREIRHRPTQRRDPDQTDRQTDTLKVSR